MKPAIRFFAPVLAMLWLGSATAQTAPRAEGIFSAVVENDSFGPSDSHYTHGMLLSYLHERNEEPLWLKALHRYLPLQPAAGLDGQPDIRTEFSLGQSIFTPVDIASPTPDPRERPYAGWLNLNAGVIVTNGNLQERLALGIGIVGPSSQAEAVQTNWHRLVGATHPAGWDYQLHDEPTLELIYERMWRSDKTALGPLQQQWLWHGGAALGNAWTYANAGATFRFGSIPDDYGVPRIGPALPGSGYFRPGNGLYGFAGFDARWVLRNIFLDGNSFRDSPSVTKRNLVGDLQVGAVWMLSRWRLTLTHVWRSKEFHWQTKSDTFDALSASFLF